jgi:hypothetical protein
VTVGAYNTATSASTSTTVDYSGKALLLKYNKDVIDGEFVRSDDRQCIFAASSLSVTPRPSDLVIYSSKTYIIKHVQEVYEASDALIYICQIRGSDNG